MSKTSILFLVFFLCSAAFIQNTQSIIVDLPWNLNIINRITTISVGDTVRWTWNDAFTHTVTSTSATAVFSSPQITGMGSQFNFTFTSAGSYPYQCSIHTTAMTGMIVVQAPSGVIVDLPWNLNILNRITNVFIGDTVRWTWADNLPHTVTSTTGLFASPTQAGVGSIFIFTFNSLGSFSYQCSIHPTQMTGTIVVMPRNTGALIVLAWNLNILNRMTTINQGDTVRWAWNDGNSHTITSDTNVFASPVLTGVGNQYNYTFNAVGTFPYHCSIHPTQMTGTIVVVQIGGITQSTSMTPRPFKSMFTNSKSMTPRPSNSKTRKINHHCASATRRRDCRQLAGCRWNIRNVCVPKLH